MRTSGLAAVSVLAAAALAGCASPSQIATDKARAHCESEGKQFILDNLEHHNGVFVETATVSGRCVGPGDPGYVNGAAPARHGGD